MKLNILVKQQKMELKHDQKKKKWEKFFMVLKREKYIASI